MDFTPIIGQVLHSFWYLIPLLFVAAVVKSPWFKGVMGEVIINLSAKFFLDREIYHLIKNVTLPVDDGTTQIDHIIVSRFGIFVIETKNMKGWIFGDAKQKMWMQKIYKHTTKFQNPLFQNYKHVKHVKTIVAEKANENACPKCGSEFRLRTVKSGVNAGSQFKGCTKFPVCRYTTN